MLSVSKYELNTVILHHSITVLTLYNASAHYKAFVIPLQSVPEDVPICNITWCMYTKKSSDVTYVSWQRFNKRVWRDILQRQPSFGHNSKKYDSDKSTLRVGSSVKRLLGTHITSNQYCFRICVLLWNHHFFKLQGIFIDNIYGIFYTSGICQLYRTARIQLYMCGQSVTIDRNSVKLRIYLTRRSLRNWSHKLITL